MVGFKSRIALCLILPACGIQLPSRSASQFPIFDTQATNRLSKLVIQEVRLAVKVNGITMTRTKSKTATLTTRDQRQEAREEAAKAAAEKAKGKSSHAAKVAAELLEEERLKELKEQEAKDEAFVQDLIDQ